jgi:hypothetical protein
MVLLSEVFFLSVVFLVTLLLANTQPVFRIRISFVRILIRIQPKN